jgi:hypothetical protein
MASNSYILGTLILLHDSGEALQPANCPLLQTLILPYETLALKHPLFYDPSPIG